MNFKKLFLIQFSIFIILFAQQSFGQTVNNLDEVITSPRCNQFTFDATQSFDADNQNLKYTWDFGDGNSSNEAIVDHTYQKSGVYTATLLVSDQSNSQCQQSVVKQRVQANIPPFASFKHPSRACSNEPIVFDASASFDDVNQSLKYTWDFGDGSTALDKKIITHSYTQGGAYKIKLSVDDNQTDVCHQSSIDRMIYVNEPPKIVLNKKEIVQCVNSPKDLTVDLECCQSKDPNNDQLKFTWDFGDGKPKHLPNLRYKFPEPGNYTVKLMVDDSSELPCSSSTETIKVILMSPPLADAGFDMSACINENITFDGSKSVIQNKEKNLIQWNFGDGQTSNELVTKHVYSKSGVFQSILSISPTIDNACPSAKDALTVKVNAPPTVSIKGPSLVCAAEEVNFDASSAQDPDNQTLEFYWTLGDGTIKRGGSKISHRYKQGGNYKVSVIVDDAQKTTCSTATASLELKVNTPPIASIGQNLTCCVNDPSEFNASGSSDPDGDRLSYQWDFGDGTTDSKPLTNHAYEKNGSYKVTLTVNDNTGTQCSQSTSGFVAEVNAKPVAKINVR